jgi:preprotein translocase subunit SecF
MQLIPPGTNINFMGKKWMAIGLSCVLILIGIISLIIHKGPRYGIDFAGGILVQVEFGKPTTPSEIRMALDKAGLPLPMIQHAWEFGQREPREYLIRMNLGQGDADALTQALTKALQDHLSHLSPVIKRVEMVGPKVGKDLRKKGLKAIIFALIGLLIYIAWRFELGFALGAILALVHDVLITLGVFSVLDKEINLPIIAAFLAIVGYSLNDTIVVYDRIRENMKKYRREIFERIINKSINETLSRTIMTSTTTLLVVMALFFLGGEVIHNFSLALLVGIMVGTYSSIFIASPVLIFWRRKSPLASRSKGR